MLTHLTSPFFSLPLSLSLLPPTELNTAQSVIEQVFSQSASLQRRPWKSKYFLNLIVRLKKKKSWAAHGTNVESVSAGFTSKWRLLTCLVALVPHVWTHLCLSAHLLCFFVTHTQRLRLKAICNSITGCAECLMLLSLFSVAPAILILPSNNVVQGVMNNKYM